MQQRTSEQSEDVPGTDSRCSRVNGNSALPSLHQSLRVKSLHLFDKVQLLVDMPVPQTVKMVSSAPRERVQQRSAEQIDQLWYTTLSQLTLPMQSCSPTCGTEALWLSSQSEFGVQKAGLVSAHCHCHFEAPRGMTNFVLPLIAESVGESPCIQLRLTRPT